MKKSHQIMVCESCLTASCWHGELMCDDSKECGTLLKTVGELRLLNGGKGLEHEDNWEKQEAIMKGHSQATRDQMLIKQKGRIQRKKSEVYILENTLNQYMETQLKITINECKIKERELDLKHLKEKISTLHADNRILNKKLEAFVVPT